LVAYSSELSALGIGRRDDLIYTPLKPDKLPSVVWIAKTTSTKSIPPSSGGGGFHQILKRRLATKIYFSAYTFPYLFFASSSLFFFHRQWHHTTNDSLLINDLERRMQGKSLILTVSSIFGYTMNNNYLLHFCSCFS
jgi:hypothetical protein